MLRSQSSCALRLASSAWRTRLSAPPPTPPLPSQATRREYSAEAKPATGHDVGVLGGGVTGLASAYFLTREYPNAKVTIYESKDRVGGWLDSRRVPVKDGNVLFEAGPRTLRPHGNGALTARLIQELDLSRDTIFTQNSAPAAKTRFVYYPDHLVRMPHPSVGLAENLWSLFSEPVFESAMWSTATEWMKEPRSPSVQDESIGDFFSRRLSTPVVDRLVSAIIHGIYAGDVWKLSAKSLFPALWRGELRHGSIILSMLKRRTEGLEISQREADFVQDLQQFSWDPVLKATLANTSVFTFKDGISMLSDRLYSKLFQTGRVEFKTSSPVELIKAAEGRAAMQVTSADSSEPREHTHIISTLSPGHLNKVSGVNLVRPMDTVNVMTVNLYFRTPGLHEPGFGYLIPAATPFENNPERALGVVFDTAYAPSPADLDPANWHDLGADELKKAREDGRLINVNDFAWINMPEAPNQQDDVTARGTKVTVMLGGHWWDGWPALPDEQEGLALARSVLERQLGIKEEPEAWQVNVQRDCIPQYTVGHEQKLKDAHNAIWRQYKGRLRVAGNWMSGVGVNDCVRSAYDVVKGFSRDGTGLEHIGEAVSLRMRTAARPASQGINRQ